MATLAPWTHAPQHTAMPYTLRLRTVVETPIFERYARGIWSADELAAFVHWIAANPNAGEVIRGSGGRRKVRWSVAGQGKRGGARVIYFSPDEDTLWLLIAYRKASLDNLPATFLAQLRQGVLDDH